MLPVILEASEPGSLFTVSPLQRRSSVGRSFSPPTTYFCEFDLLLVEHTGRGGAASAVHKPSSVSNQNDIGPFYSLRHPTGQRVPHLVLQGSAIGVDLKTTKCNERDSGGQRRCTSSYKRNAPGCAALLAYVGEAGLAAGFYTICKWFVDILLANSQSRACRTGSLRLFLSVYKRWPVLQKKKKKSCGPRIEPWGTPRNDLCLTGRTGTGPESEHAMTTTSSFHQHLCNTSNAASIR